MKKEDLFKAMADVDPELIEEAHAYHGRKVIPAWMKWGTLAACAVIVIGALFVLPALQNRNWIAQKGNLSYGGGNGAAAVTATTTTKRYTLGGSDGDDVSYVDASGEQPDDATTTAAADDTTTAKSNKTTATGANAKGKTTTTAKSNKTTATKSGGTSTTTKTTTEGTARAGIGTTNRRTTTTAGPSARTTTKRTTTTTKRTTTTIKPTTPTSNGNVTVSEKNGIKSYSPVYPDLASDSYLTRRDRWEKAKTLQSGMNRYYTNVMKKLLTAGNENTVCSPLSTYLSFAMLAETSGGNTRQQILNMLGVSSIDTLRDNVSTLWQANYNTAEEATSLLANSMWLKKGVTYNEDTLKRLATQYYASSFIGTPGSSAMDQALRQWTNENTGGLLSQYTKNMSLPSDTVLALVSTIYFKSNWAEKFRAESNTRETFHGTKGDTTVDMMHRTEVMDVYRTSRFMSVGLSLHGGTMYFLLPNKNVDVNSLLTDANVLSVLQKDYSDSHWSEVILNLSLPKFSVSAKSDLTGMLRSLGVTDAMDSQKANFTPLASGREIFLAKAEHAAMVQIDEKGVTAAAYTEDIMAEPWAEERLDFTIDRPFMFIVTGGGGSILFSGIVRNI